MHYRRSGSEQQDTIYEVFSDMALLMLASFIFIFAMLLMFSQMQGQGKSQKSEAEIASLYEQLQASKKRNLQLQEELNTVAGTDVQQQLDKVQASAGWGKGQGKRDFDLFILGLKDLPGQDLHLVLDATGSMHGATSFLIPILRLIAIRSRKNLSAVSWYGDKRTGTYSGTMGEMFDHLMQDAPFIGTEETIGRAFRDIVKNAPVPGAYLLIGDEPSTDRIQYHAIPAPVFT
ncbi:MAG: hypothetical protein Q9M22_04945, partial [Mariprofundaceae bacterium]|nr:hypothetical protein [Mariprofundaceae bacterium]